MEIWRKPGVSVSDADLINEIKEVLVNKLNPKLGYDAKLYKSDIINIVLNEVEEVERCVVLNPRYDIFFEYDFSSMAEEFLLHYSPNLILLSKKYIDIKLRG